jgi:glycosyltransferase involved in cell wall biosynthesis
MSDAATAPASEAELAGAIAAALQDRDALRAKGLERARAFSWRAVADATVDVYREAAG